MKIKKGDIVKLVKNYSSAGMEIGELALVDGKDENRALIYDQWDINQNYKMHWFVNHDEILPVLQFRYVKPNRRYFGHTNVYYKGQLVGYFIPAKPGYRFVPQPNMTRLNYLDASNKRNMMKRIMEALNVKFEI